MNKENKLVVQFTDDFDHKERDAAKAIGVYVIDRAAFAETTLEIMNGAFEKNSVSESVEMFDDWDIPVRMKLLLLLKHIENLDRVIIKNELTSALSTGAMKAFKRMLEERKND